MRAVASRRCASRSIVANVWSREWSSTITHSQSTPSGAIADAITPATRLVFLANPNNPTGTIFFRSQWHEFLAAVPPHAYGAVLVIIGIVLAATIMGVLVSEMTSNTASASLVVPVVLALNGISFTLSIELALASDIVVAAEVLGHDAPMHKYAVQITVADVRDGACSSSTLQEAASWGKVSTVHEQMVFAD